MILTVQIHKWENLCDYIVKDSENLLQGIHKTNYKKRNMCVIPHIGHNGFAPMHWQHTWVALGAQLIDICQKTKKT